MSVERTPGNGIEELRRANRTRTEGLTRSIERGMLYPAAVAAVSTVSVVALLYFLIPALLAGGN